MPLPGALAAVLLAYLDASKREAGTFSVAAVAFGEDRAKKATRRWVELWGETRCHMTDLNARGGKFAHWAPEQAGAQLKESIKIINRYLSFGVAVSCDVADVNRLSPKSADPGSIAFFGGFTRAYALCCHMAMHSLAKMAVDRQVSRSRDIAYFFEAGDLHQGDSQRFISTMVSGEIGRSFYGYRSHSVLKKEDARLFEMTDILAWEWAKHIERVREHKTSMRRSLRALLGDGVSGEFDFASRTRRAFHLHGQPLERYFKQAEELGLFSDRPSEEQHRSMAANLWRAQRAMAGSLHQRPRITGTGPTRSTAKPAT
jgi:hypothetical protein